MNSHDFDPAVQEVFSKQYREIAPTDWKSWLKISTNNAYEDLCLKLSGLSDVKDLFDYIRDKQTESREFSIDVERYIKNYESSSPLILCHTSGTTDSKKSALKWFDMTKDIVRRTWAPGMQAIFESSGLSSDGSVVIFIPSRMDTDGLKELDGKSLVSLYSSEFSQRLMLSLIKPKSYLIYEYRNSKDIDILIKILSLEKITAISAPAATILGWADFDKLKRGLEKSLKQDKTEKNSADSWFYSEMKAVGFDGAVKKLQSALSEKIANACLVFSISSLSESDWTLIRNFMKWKKGEERFTNLYVASEVGPLASSIHNGDFSVARSNQMYLFPTYLPVIEYRSKKELVSRTKTSKGGLYISREDTNGPLININLGDVVKLVKNEGLPLIEGKILRNSFRLKYPIKISKKIPVVSNYQACAGDLFQFKQFDIFDPRRLLNFLSGNCGVDIDSLLLVKFNSEGSSGWNLYIQESGSSRCKKVYELKNLFSKIPFDDGLIKAISSEIIDIKLIDEPPVTYFLPRSEMVKKVQKGEIPKGILKKWPLYIIM